MTERELMEKVTPGFIRWLIRYAPGFELIEDSDRMGLMLIEYKDMPVMGISPGFLALLLSEALEGMNNFPDGRYFIIRRNDYFGVSHIRAGRPYTRYSYPEYEGAILRPWQCALLHCMMDVYDEICATAPVAG